MVKRVLDAKADDKGNISKVLLSGNTTFTPIDTAIKMAEKGKIENAHAVTPKNRKKYLRTNPDAQRKNNLDDMAGDR